MSEKIEVYNSLRNEIISFEETQRNVWIYMYVLFGTLFILGLQWSHFLFLISYIILIPFQCVINDYAFKITKMASYIRVFFEKENIGINWESINLWSQYKEYDNKKKKSFHGILKVSGAVHLGFLATAFYCGYTLKLSYMNNKFVLGWLNVSLIVLSIILLMILVIINKDYYKNYNTELDELMAKYKDEILQKNEQKQP